MGNAFEGGRMRFTIQISGIPTAVKQTENFLHRTARSFVGELWDELVDVTPVASGRAAASWMISSSPHVETLPPGEYGRPATPSIPLKFRDLYVVNPLDYIVYLNQGSSEQAPALFVESTLTALVFLENIRIRLSVNSLPLSSITTAFSFTFSPTFILILDGVTFMVTFFFCAIVLENINDSKINRNCLEKLVSLFISLKLKLENGGVNLRNLCDSSFIYSFL